jgi:hypothetical protein
MPGCPLSSGITSILRKNVAQEEDITLITNEVNIHHIISFYDHKFRDDYKKE